ncbi:hypothetical protein Tco_0696311 [Tanacetum coccineum]
MTSFDYRLNPIYAIKECSSCGSLYTSNCGCSKGSLEDKILVPKPPRNCARCARCGTPVDGPYCQGCALLRKKFKEDLFTYYVENEFFEDLQDTSESSDDNTNVVNAPQEPKKEIKFTNCLYTSNCGCSKGSLEDKILVPKPPRNCARCAKCGTPVDGPYCQGCALLRKKFKEDLFTYCVENEFFEDLQDTSESSDDNTNVVNAPQEPFVGNQDPGENSSPSPLHIDHCCHECGDSLDGIFCRQCTCKSCGKGAHYGYNCPPKVPIISNPEPCKNQTIGEHLQNLQSLQQQCLLGTCQKCGCNEYNGVCFYCKVGNGTQINVSTPYSSNDSPSVANHPPQSQYVPYSRDYVGTFSLRLTIVHLKSRYLQSGPCFQSRHLLFSTTSPEFSTTIFFPYKGRKKKSESRKNKRLKIDLGRFPFATMMTKTIPLQSHPFNNLDPITPTYGDKNLDTNCRNEIDEFISLSVEGLVPIPCESELIPDKMYDSSLLKYHPLLMLSMTILRLLSISDDEILRVMTIIPYGEISIMLMRLLPMLNRHLRW